MVYKKGDKVKVVASTDGHLFKIGQEVVVMCTAFFSGELNYSCQSADGDDYWLVEAEMQPVPNGPTYTPQLYTGQKLEYGKYLVVRKDGKIHFEVYNGTGWAYNGKVIEQFYLPKIK